MKAKRLLVALLSLIMLCGIAASVFAGGRAQSDGAKSDKLHFVYVSPLLAHPVWLIAKNGFDAACQELGIQGDWVGPQGISPEEMAKLVDTAVAQKADAIITQGIVPAPPVQNAISAGIPVLVVDSDIPDAQRLAFLGKDTKIQARLLYEDVLQRLGPNTPLNVSIQVSNLLYEVAHRMIADIEEAFGRHPGGFKLVNTSESKSEKIQSVTEWERTFNAYPEINVAINFAAEAGPACATVVKEKGIRDKMLVYAVDDVDETLEILRKNEIDGTIVTSFWNYGYQATYWLYQNITQSKRPAQVVNDAGTILVSNKNVDTYADALRVKKDL
ncbi:MAG: substrate-binding domain-containing protein [Treponema sp.]|jgi:ribose transport system substrate-binding protein|nr:substrate-binding domain-containing protein [Treponema sp.]